MNTFWLNAGFLDLPFVLTALMVLFPMAGPPPPWQPPGWPFPLDCRSRTCPARAALTRSLLHSFHVTHASSHRLFLVPSPRCQFASFPPPSSRPGFSRRWGRNLGVGPGCRAASGRVPHGCAGGLRWELARGAAAGGLWFETARGAPSESRDR